MLPPLTPRANHYGHDVASLVPSANGLTGIVELSPGHDEIWRRAKKYLAVRDNDVHTLYAYGIGHALVSQQPDADPDVVLPAILLHDTGWSQVPEDDVLSAIAPGAGRKDLVLQHEREGARIAQSILDEVGWDADRTSEIVAIVDGHDSRREAVSLNDALMKDADKIWRLTPHGVDTVMNWFGLTREEAHRLIASRVHDHLLSDTGRAFARLLAAIVSIDTDPERVALG
ncbi:HD domain-containing protein [Gordonia rhizosphera]|uniref:HD domain-containing protein n=1 Tax=Gordonia rhizosphera NBRC 16068 TaxID=1108045 RepID=K6WHC2_9ACTN|nr:HD domain-containing protein [Gordonia rhizosphera]GAB91557.1 hypothetical protein GORHZ_136_00200 [Gordonia rhizosphera NBRC 16068]